MQLNLTTTTRIGLNVLGLLGVAVLLRLGESIFIPLTFAVLIAAILWPVAEWLHKRRVPWSIACIVSVVLMLLLFVGVSMGLALAVPRMLQGLPDPRDAESVQAHYNHFRSQVAKISPGNIDAVLPERAEDSRLLHIAREALRAERLEGTIRMLLSYLASYLVQLTLVMFVALFLLMEGKMLTLRVVEIFGPSEQAQSTAVGVLAEIAHSVRAYLVWRTVVNIGLAIVLGGVYQLIGLKQAWTWALLAAILCYVPYIGTIIAGLPPAVDAFIFLGPGYALGILIFYAAVVTFEGYVIVPVVMGRSMDMNATTVLLGCLFWDLVWGTPGLFLAMPLMAALKAVCMSVPAWRPLANLMGTDEGPVRFVEAPDGPPPPLPPPPDPEKTLLMEESPLVKEITPDPPPGEAEP